MATYSNIYIDQGSTYSSIIDVKDSNGLPFNLTGYESRGQIRKSYSSANTTVFATNINLPLEGKVAVSLTAGQTRSLKAGRYIYDVEIFNDGGHVVRIAEGQVEINPGIANDDAVVLPPTPVLIEIIDDRIDDRIDNFNLNQIITLNGDAIGSSGTGLINVSLATTGVAAGTYGGTATSNRTFTVDSKGRITAVGAATTITPSFASITGKPNSISGYNITDAASKTYVDEITSHETVRVITKQALALNYSNTNFGQLISNTSVNWTELLSDPGLVLGSRLLIAGQSTKAHNGIYVIVDNTTLQRAVDFNSSRKMAGGDTVFVTHGIYADTCWALRETVTAVGTSPVEFVQISGAGAVEVGNGLVRNGTTIGMSTIGTAGTYRSVTTDAYGRVTTGSNPTTLNNYGITDAVSIDTVQSITGQKEFSLSPHVPLEPTEASHVVSKSYVDAVAEGLNVHQSARVLLRTPLAVLIGGGATVEYNNGVEGVGATLVSSTNVDWATKLSDPELNVGNRIVVAGESNDAYNGIYVIDSATTLIRADDLDSSVEMDGGDFVFVTHGTYAGTGWVLNRAVPIVGSSSVSFAQFSGAGAYEAGSGLLRDGTIFSVKASTGITVSADGVSLSTTGTAGTYRSVTTDAYGRVTAGSNPTTLEGYGITDAVTRNTAESITGQKTFESNVNVPLNPTEATHAVSKSYVDAVAEEINQPALIRTAAEGPPLDNTTNADFVGQLLRVGNAAPYRWFRALTSGINISTWTEDVDTTSTILKKLQGEEEDPNKIGKEYLPVGVDPQLDPVAVADSAARKLASTYVNAGITPYVGLRVIQTDQPDVVWTLLSITNITLDANWAGTPRTNANGQLPLKGIKLVDGNIPLSFSQHISIDDIRWIKNSSANVLPLLTSVQIPGSLMVPGNKIAFTGNYRYFKNSGGVGTNCFFTFGPKTLWDEVNNSPNGGYLSTVYFPQVPFAVVPADLNAVGYFHSVFTLTSVTTDPTKLYLLANTNFPDGGATSIVDGVLSYETLPLPTGTVNSSGLHTYLVGADTEVIV